MFPHSNFAKLYNRNLVKGQKYNLENHKNLFAFHI